MKYTIKIFPYPEGDGDYIAEVEELYGCSASGKARKLLYSESKPPFNPGLKLPKNMENRFL